MADDFLVFSFCSLDFLVFSFCSLDKFVKVFPLSLKSEYTYVIKRHLADIL